MSLVWSTNGASGSVYEELTATLNFNDDDANLIYVDWDDGESNKLNEANYQWVKNPTPTGSISLKHTYTAADTFYPVVQSITSKGFASRYYSATAASATDVTPHTIDTAVSGVTINDSAATAIMRVENRTVKSGIDNSILNIDTIPSALGRAGYSNDWRIIKGVLHVCVPPLMTASEMDYIEDPQLEIEVLMKNSIFDNRREGVGIPVGDSLTYKKLQVNLSSSASTPWYKYWGTEGVMPLWGEELFPVQPPLSGASVVKVLSVKYMNPRPATESYASYDAYNKLKIFILTPSNAEPVPPLSNPEGIKYAFAPITYVSAGSPYKKADDLSRYATLDFSQGRAAASNKSISYYRYDIWKGVV